VQFGYDGEGNIDEDPLFVSPTEGIGLEYDGLEADWSLLDNSTSINSGTPDTTGYFLPSYDLSGGLRIFGYRIDIGAYENQAIVSLAEKKAPTYKVETWPNPFENTINISSTIDIKSITVINQCGAIINSINYTNTSAPKIMDLSRFETGIYYLKIETNNGKVIRKKIIKIN
jgi:hypothetical protein